MEDRILEIIGKYDFDVYNTFRTRGAYVLDTNQGLKLLCGYEGGENRLLLEDTVKNQLRARGYTNLDMIVHTKEDGLTAVNGLGEKFVVKDWFEAEECNSKKEDGIRFAAVNLAFLHNCMQQLDIEDEQVKTCYQTPLPYQMEKRMRELKRVKTYIRERKQKNEFELCYLGIQDLFYQDAIQASDMLKEINYEEIYRQARDDKNFCHGCYTYHNVLILKENKQEEQCRAAQLDCKTYMATTNFEHLECGLQILDLNYFLRKVMEKNHWDTRLGKIIIDEYAKHTAYSKADQKLLQILLTFPEKFWKVTNYYFNSKKSWIPQKNVQKLQTLSEQIECKRRFIEQLDTY